MTKMTKMTKQFKRFTLTLLLMLVSGSTGWAQEQPAADRPESISLKVQVIISRYQGDELVSSLPYMLTVGVAAGGSSLRMGAEVPVLTITQPVAPTADNRILTPFTYRPVGTNITCTAQRLEGDRYRLRINLEESSVYGDDPTSLDAVMAPGAPVFRSFESNTNLVLRDGQSSQYTAAVDRISGESIRVDVTLTVLE